MEKLALVVNDKEAVFEYRELNTLVINILKWLESIEAGPISDVEDFQNPNVSIRRPEKGEFAIMHFLRTPDKVYDSIIEQSSYRVVLKNLELKRRQNQVILSLYIQL